jgi:hypothetical protein
VARGSLGEAVGRAPCAVRETSVAAEPEFEIGLRRPQGRVATTRSIGAHVSRIER